MFSSRLGCSSISFRHQPLPEALRTIREAGLQEIDLGALPGVCHHVPCVLDGAAVDRVAADVHASGLHMRSVNGDVGDLNAVLDDGQRDDRAAHLDILLELTAAVGVELWCESLHFFRLCWHEDRAQRLAAELGGTGVGVVMDFSHVVASGGGPVHFVETFADRITHVHLRDATAGNFNLSIGNGEADFAAGLRALERAGYGGHFSLELETRDVTHEQRPAATRAAAQYISSLL